MRLAQRQTTASWGLMRQRSRLTWRLSQPMSRVASTLYVKGQGANVRKMFELQTLNPTGVAELLPTYVLLLGLRRGDAGQAGGKGHRRDHGPRQFC
jgi:hypothetical protein